MAEAVNDAIEPVSDPRAWAAVDGQEGWFVLMDHAAKFAQPRLILSKTDEHFVRMAVMSAFPGAKLRVIADGTRKFFARQVRAQ